jgi:hypothetical protein
LAHLPLPQPISNPTDEDEREDQGKMAKYAFKNTFSLLWPQRRLVVSAPLITETLDGLGVDISPLQSHALPINVTNLSAALARPSRTHTRADARLKATHEWTNFEQNLVRPNRTGSNTATQKIGCLRGLYVRQKTMMTNDGTAIQNP